MQSDRDKCRVTTTASSAQVRTLDSLELFGSCQRIDIQHQGEVYRLQITRQGKLILTK